MIAQLEKQEKSSNQLSFPQASRKGKRSALLFPSGMTAQLERQATSSSLSKQDDCATRRQEKSNDQLFFCQRYDCTIRKTRKVKLPQQVDCTSRKTTDVNHVLSSPAGLLHN